MEEEDMAIEPIKRAAYRSALDHPFIFGSACVLLILYIFFPSLFTLLVSSSPVIICTALLLGTLLCYGEPNIPQLDEEDKNAQRIPPLKVGAIAKDFAVKKDESVGAETHVDSRKGGRKMAVREAALDDGWTCGGTKAIMGMPVSTTQNDCYRSETSMATNSYTEKDTKANHAKKIVTKERERSDYGPGGKEKFSSEKISGGVIKAAKDIAGASYSDRKETEGLTVETDSESDQEEISSPDTSVTDITPMLDELHPLLDSEPLQSALGSKENSEVASLESDDSSAEDEIENQEDDDGEAHDDKDDGDKVVTWTADDQKNLIELGSSELERNRRVETMIAKRTASKILRSHMEKNLIDLDANDPLTSMEDLSCFQVQIPPISAPRRNPFDLPNDSDIPGSAPSVLLPSRNPFDLPYGQVDESGNHIGENLSNPVFGPVPQRDMLFRRHESFTIGASFFGDVRQDRSRLKPFFVAERMDTEETVSADLQNQSSERSTSKVSSIPESDSSSLVSAQDDHKELLQQNWHQESVSTANHGAETVDRESHSLEEVELVDSELVQNGKDVTDDRGTHLDNGINSEETHQTAEDFGSFGEEISDESETHSPISEDEKVEVIDERYHPGSSSSSEADEKSAKQTSLEQSADLEQAELTADSQVADPLYDSSPSAIEKSNSIASALDEAFFNVGKGGFNSNYSLTPDMQSDISEAGSTPATAERNVSTSQSTGEELASASGMLWVAAPSLASVDENESRSREISEIRERDILGDELSGVHEDLDDANVSVLQKLASGKMARQRHISISLVESESSEDSSS